MKFRFEHEFDVDVERLEEAMFSEELPAFLKEHMPSLKDMEVLERREEGERLMRKVRYEPVPLIEKVGPKRVPPEAMIWVEESSYDRKRKVLDFKNVPTHPKVRGLMKNYGTVELQSAGPGKSRRTMQGELKVSVPILGRVAEKIIFKTAGKVIEEEAKALEQFLASRS